jgi:hypothetical protein
MLVTIKLVLMYRSEYVCVFRQFCDFSLQILPIEFLLMAAGMALQTEISDNDRRMC